MSRSSSSAVVLLLSVVFLLSTTASAFNITRLLDQYPDFAQFNSLLSQTQLAGEINRRRTITVLALTNDRIGELAGKSEDLSKRILSTHVVLDYYDILKLNKLKGNKTVLTTLFQSTGIANEQQGFLNVAHSPDGIFFGSAMKGAPIDVKLEGSVASQPYNISVLSVSRPIIAPGIDGVWRPVSAPPPAPVAAAAPKDDVPADAPAADADAHAAEVGAPTPLDGPTSAPGSEASPADADATTPSNGAGEKIVSGVSLGLIVGLVSLWI